jgi:putative transposase
LPDRSRISDEKQRGNRRQPTFFTDQDYAEYRGLLADSCRRCATQVLAYCLMPNHVHLITVPGDALGLRDRWGRRIADIPV